MAQADSSLDATIRQAARLVLAAEYVTALTGAGISVESGIPPFRGPGGLWTKYGEPPMDGYQRFLLYFPLNFSGQRASEAGCKPPMTRFVQLATCRETPQKV